MVWGSFSAKRRGSLYFIEPNKTVDSNAFLNILKSKLQMSMLLNACRVFQQDSAPAHTSRKVTQWLTGNGIQVLDWPGNSPDLNSIENLLCIRKKDKKVPS